MSDHADRMIDDATRALSSAGITTGSSWRHWKGERVRIIAAAIDEAMLQPVVCYEHNGTTWTRTLKDWQTLIMGVDGQPVARFTPVGLEDRPDGRQS